MEEFRNMLVGSVHEALKVFDFPIWVFVDPLVDICVERILADFNSRERMCEEEVFKIMRREIIDELRKGNFFEVGEGGNSSGFYFYTTWFEPFDFEKNANIIDEIKRVFPDKFCNEPQIYTPENVQNWDVSGGPSIDLPTFVPIKSPRERAEGRPRSPATEQGEGEDSLPAIISARGTRMLICCAFTITRAMEAMRALRIKYFVGFDTTEEARIFMTDENGVYCFFSGIEPLEQLAIICKYFNFHAWGFVAEHFRLIKDFLNFYGSEFDRITPNDLTEKIQEIINLDA
jgi:hypothetical protein